VRLESEEKEEGITHHGCGAAGTPSGLRSLFLLPAWELSMWLCSHAVSYGQRNHGHVQPGSGAAAGHGRDELAHLGREVSTELVVLLAASADRGSEQSPAVGSDLQGGLQDVKGGVCMPRR
jgi:hypothetical protein